MIATVVPPGALISQTGPASEGCTAEVLGKASGEPNVVVACAIDTCVAGGVSNGRATVGPGGPLASCALALVFGWTLGRANSTAPKAAAALMRTATANSPNRLAVLSLMCWLIALSIDPGWSRR